MAVENLSPAVQELKATVDQYIDYSVETGVLTTSRIRFQEEIGRFSGITHIPGDDGIDVSKHNSGYLQIHAAYFERTPRGVVEVNSRIEITDQPAVVEIHERLEGKNGHEVSRTVKKIDHDRVAAELSTRIKALYE